MKQADPALSDTPEGWVDSRDEGAIRGWVWYPGRPERAMNPQAPIEGKVAAKARTTATLERPDLTPPGKNGAYGFSIPLALKDLEAHRIVRVRLRVQDGPCLPHRSI